MSAPFTTRITGLRRWPGFLEGLREIVDRGTLDIQLRDREIHAFHPWFRDHIHILKFARFFDPDPASALQFVLDQQHETGFFYEILTSADDDHHTFVDEPHVRWLGTPGVWASRRRGRSRQRAGAVLVRLELEADVEYLVAEAVARIWEATGDRKWLEAALPRVEQGLGYCLSHPKRWNVQHGLLMRPFTIDTWDFAWGQHSKDRRIHPTTPMAIHYGDNTGLYAAAKWLGAILGSNKWQQAAEEVRERTNRLCWNGRHYTHQVLLDPVETGGPAESEMLSLSNPYAINRGLADADQASAIIDCYRRLREETRETSIAEWFTLYPPYPEFVIYQAWDYVNGGVAPFVGGELALAALEHGWEEYGVDILHRLYQLWSANRELKFMVRKDGTPTGIGPDAWGAAAVGNALLRGLAGVHLHAGEGRIRLRPAWAATDEDAVSVEVGYPASGFGVAYEYAHDRAARTLSLGGRASVAPEVALLLPKGAREVEVTAGGRPVEPRATRIRESEWVGVDAAAVGEAGDWSIQVQYAP